MQNEGGDSKRLIRQETCIECEIIKQRCSGDECCESAKGCGVKAAPVIAVDGKMRFVGKPSISDSPVELAEKNYAE